MFQQIPTLHAPSGMISSHLITCLQVVKVLENKFIALALDFTHDEIVSSKANS